VASRKSTIVLPTSQWASHGWAAQWRRGNESRDRYELTHRGQYVAIIVVTRAGWKWAEPDPKRRGMAKWTKPYAWSPDIYPTWQEAVTAYARRYRRRRTAQFHHDVELPDQWIPVQRDRQSPWTPKPMHDDFRSYEQDPE
jgi:hypothetical protein